MNNSEVYIKEAVAKRAEKEDGYSITPNIPDKILINASNKIAQGIDPKTIIAVFDNSMFGNGKEGIVFTGIMLHFKEAFLPYIALPLTDISNTDFTTETKTLENGKTETKQTLTVNYASGETITIKNTDYPEELEFIFELLNGMKESVDEIQERKQTVMLSELSESIICSYINIIAAYLKADDQRIDPEEYKELLSLMARIKVSKSTAEKLRGYRLGNEALNMDFQSAIDNLAKQLIEEKIDNQSIFQSLFRDLLLVRKDNLDNWQADGILCELKGLLGITDSQTEMLIRSIRDDMRIIEERLDDNQVKEITKELAALAGGAGVTIAALTVTGGVSSGIAGGLLSLGLMSTGGMLLGLAVIGGLGYGAYKGIKYFSGTSELEKSGIRISALQSAMECSKAAVTYIVEDINYLTLQLGEIYDKLQVTQENNEALVSKFSALVNHLKLVSGAGTRCENSAYKNEYEINLAKLPLDLSLGKFNELVNKNPERAAIKEFILSIYKETSVSSIDNSGNEVLKTVYRRDEELLHDDAAKAYNYLDMIGYYSTKASASAQGSALLKKGMSSLRNMING